MGIRPNLELHQKMAEENRRARAKAELTDKLINVLCIVLCPIFFFVFLIIGLGTSKKR